MTDLELRDVLRQRLDAVETRIRNACDRARRDRHEVTLIAVTKTVDVRVARIMAEFGVLDCGESRPQELWRKADALHDLPVRWHCIGHLQRNKVERTIPLVMRIHSIDSVRLLESVDAACLAVNRPLLAMLEINVSREAAKHGFRPEELPQLAETIAQLRSVRIDGLMTMAAFTETPEATRSTFAELRRLRDQLPGIALPHLSMGMSNDFEIAIEEGATLVRIGTTLFEGLGKE